MWEIGDTMAKGAALMTDTTVTSRKPIRVAAAHEQGGLGNHLRQYRKSRHAEVERSRPDSREGGAKELGVEEKGLPTEIPKLNGRVTIPDDEKRGGGSDDIGDISWTVPTVTLRYPANIEAGPGHNWANAIAMATPIAHKGVTAGAKVQVMTVLDLLMKPELVEQSWMLPQCPNKGQDIHAVDQAGG